MPIAGLPEGEHEFCFDEPASALGLGPGFSDVHVEALLEKTPNELHLMVKVETQVSCTCDRCLAEFSESLSSTYHMHYLYDASGTRRYDQAEVQVISPGTPSLDIAEDVSQTIQVAVPLKLLCKSTCKGLCPGCGKNLNDGPCECRPEPLAPQWDALRDLRIKE